MRTLPAVGLVLILSGLGAYYATDTLSWFSIGNLVLGPLVLLAAAVQQSRRVTGFRGARSRAVVLRWSAILAGLLLLIIGLNVLASDWDARLDLTVAQSYTLSDQTRSLCQEVRGDAGSPGADLWFFEESLLAKDVRLLVQAYDADCAHVDVHEVGLEEAPAEPGRIYSNFNTTVVACHAARCEPVGYPSEENITNALLRLVRTDDRRAYFMIGHGEVDLASESEAGYSGFAAVLRNEGITASAIVGPSREEIPDDANLLILASPERDFLPPELKALERYLQRGGRLLALLEPGIDTNLLPLLERWGFGLPQAVVADTATSPLVRDPKPVALIAHLFSTTHPVTRKMSNRTMVLMPSARPVGRSRKPEQDDRLDDLVFSSRRAWAESDVSGALAGREISPDPGEGGEQEIPIAAAGRYPRENGEARIVVFGDRDFASNRLLSSLYGRDLLLNAIWWLAEDDSKITIRPKFWTPHQDPLTLQQTVAYFYFMAFALPEALLLLGIHAWFRQRS